MEILEEAFNYSSDMDVSELRRMYYGRSNLYVSFSDTIFYRDSGRSRGTLTRPQGIVLHSVVDVVAKKVSTPYLYANVCRIELQGWVTNIQQYSSIELDNDIDKLLTMFGDDDFVKTVIAYVIRGKKFTTKFELLWDITKRLSKNDDVRWNEILTELGYIGFIDERGSGVFGTRFPSAIALTEDALTYLDTLKIQHRKDERRRTAERVKAVRTKEYNVTNRNRVDKREGS